MTAYGVIKGAGIWQDVLDIMNGGRFQDHEVTHLRRNLEDQDSMGRLSDRKAALLAAIRDGSFNPNDENSRCEWSNRAESYRGKS